MPRRPGDPSGPSRLTRPAAAVPEVLGIQYLRALAAAAVVFFHLAGQIQPTPDTVWATSALSSGVDLFFVISGFVMAWSSLRSRHLSARIFVERRLIRIVPLYWLVTALMLAVLLIAPHLLRTARLAWPHAIASFLFVPAINPATGLYEPLAIPGWTLIYEMAFYALFAAAILLARGAAMRTLGVAVALLTVVTAIGYAVAPAGIAGFYTRPIVMEFAAGIVVALLVRRAAPVPQAVLVAIAAIGLLALFWPPDFGLDRAIRRGVPALVVVLAVAWCRMPRWNALRVVGDASYSLYLSQVVSVAVAVKLAGAAHLLGGPAARMVALVGGWAGCIVAGVMVWWLVERPLTRAIRRHLDRALRRPSVSDAGEGQIGAIR